MNLLAAVEGGGTKFLCALATAAEPSAILATGRIDTAADAAITIERVLEFLRHEAAKRGARVVSLGMASFGPIELDRQSPEYGHVLPTPKAGWSGAPVLAMLADGLGLPLERVRWDTDVNAAALGEARWGAGRGADPLIYVTVGTGIGGGAVVGGRPLHGLLHPEMGHVPVPAARLADGSLDTFPGFGCPFHSRCWEAMASGPALAARLGTAPDKVGRDHPVWDLEAQYLAYGLATCVLVLSPRRIVIGGGVVESRAAWLLPRVRDHLGRTLNGYISRGEVTRGLDDYLVPAQLGSPSPAIVGALLLASGALEA